MLCEWMGERYVLAVADGMLQWVRLSLMLLSCLACLDNRLVREAKWYEDGLHAANALTSLPMSPNIHQPIDPVTLDFRHAKKTFS